MRQRSVLPLALLALVLACPSPARPAACPQALADASRLVLVVTPDMEGPAAHVSAYERAAASGSWRRIGDEEPAVVGSAGLGWGLTYRSLAAEGEPLKVEGDRRTPAGIYRLGPTFGFEPSAAAGHLLLEPDRHLCVDDLDSEHYGHIVPRSVAGPHTRGEEMAGIGLYRRGIVVDYPSDRLERSGSCIFVHVWEAPRQGTSGCVALPEPSVARLQEWSASAPAAIAILPRAALDRLAGCLPD